jgi:hypothetical protein
VLAQKKACIELNPRDVIGDSGIRKPIDDYDKKLVIRFLLENFKSL